MGRSKLFLGFIVVLSLTLLPSVGAFAFHGGGVAHCNGCHSMHNSDDNPASGTPNSTLLKGSDASSTCLNCHNGSGGYHLRSSDGSNLNQGGDFYWVSNPYSVVVRGNTAYFGGDNAGHNIIATDFGLDADQNPSNAQAPGGSYPANILGCTSCHDAHGQVHGGTSHGNEPISVSGSYGAADPTDGTIHGNYRLLGDDQYTTGDEGPGEIQFVASAPVATASDVTGSSVAYGEGMSEWCGNCHGSFLVSTSNHRHPSGKEVQLDNAIADNYNSYISTGNYNGTNFYDVLVPVEMGKGDGSLLDPANPFDGDGASESNVMCLTCHRAHASANNNAGRWDFEVAFLAESHALVSPDVPATANPYYGDGVRIDVVSRYGQYQRSLCNKCHVQD